MHIPVHSESSFVRTGVLLREHPLFADDEGMASRAAQCTELIQLGLEDVLIGMGRDDRDLYLIFFGSVDVLLDGELTTRRGKGQVVGELELISPDLKRVSTVVARELTMVGRISEPDFTDLAEEYPILWRRLASNLVHRVLASPGA